MSIEFKGSQHYRDPRSTHNNSFWVFVYGFFGALFKVTRPSFLHTFLIQVGGSEISKPPRDSPKQFFGVHGQHSTHLQSEVHLYPKVHVTEGLHVGTVTAQVPGSPNKWSPQLCRSQNLKVDLRLMYLYVEKYLYIYIYTHIHLYGPYTYTYTYTVLNHGGPNVGTGVPGDRNPMT